VGHIGLLIVSRGPNLGQICFFKASCGPYVAPPAIEGDAALGFRATGNPQFSTILRIMVPQIPKPII